MNTRTRARDAITDLGRADHVDLQDHIPARGQPVLHEATRRAGTVSDDLGPFEQLARPDHPVESVVVEEEVVDPVDLSRSGGAGRHRDRQRESLGVAGDQLPDDAALPHPRGAGENEELPGADGRLTS